MCILNNYLKACVGVFGFIVAVYIGPLCAAENMLNIQAQPEVTIAIAMAGDKVHGTLRKAPLQGVLDKLSQLEGFTYRLPETYADYAVSQRLDPMALIDAIKSILQPFNYVLSIDAKRKIKEIRILGLQHDADRLVVQELPAFMPSGKALPTNIVTPPLPPFTPVMNATGPGNGEQEHSGTLPRFEPVINDTGPPYDKRSNTKQLPPFFMSLPEGANKP